MKKILLLFSILILSGCTQNTEEKTIIDDLTDSGYILGEIGTTDPTFEVTIISTKSIHDSLSDDFGIIYEVSTEDAELFYQNRIDYSYTVNDIVFIYKVGNHVFEMYHSTTSTFPGFLRHYEFEANYQYYAFYTDELTYPPIISTLIEDGATVTYTYTETELLENGFSEYNIPYRTAYQISDENIGTSVLVIEVNSIEDAILLYENQANRFFSASAYSQMVVRYQNLVFKIAYPHYTQSEVLSAIMGDVVYEMYDEEDLINSLN